MRATRLPAVAVVLLLAGACSGDGAEGYTEEFRGDFVDRCRGAYPGADSDAVCGCWYESVSAAIDRDRLPSLDDLVEGALDDGADRVPGDAIDEALHRLAECVRRLGAAPTLPATTAPSPTEPPPPPPPTTTTVVA